jgi:hypothetical protein
MAFKHGRFAEISVNSKDLSSFCDSADISIDIDTADTTTFGSDWKSAVVGAAGGKFDIKGMYDPTDTTGPVIVLTDLVGADPFTVILYPGGNTAGQISHTFDAILTNYAEGSPVGDKVTFSASMLASGEVATDVIGA